MRPTLFNLDEIIRVENMRREGRRFMDVVAALPNHTPDEVQDAWWATILRTPLEAMTKVNRDLLDRWNGKILWPMSASMSGSPYA